MKASTPFTVQANLEQASIRQQTSLKPSSSQFIGSTEPIPVCSSIQSQQVSNNDNRSQEELMKHLNFSIEDLLSKISKVTEQHEQGSKDIIQRAPKQQTKKDEKQNKELKRKENVDRIKESNLTKQIKPKEGADQLKENQTKHRSEAETEQSSNSSSSHDILIPNVILNPPPPPSSLKSIHKIPSSSQKSNSLHVIGTVNDSKHNLTINGSSRFGEELRPGMKVQKRTIKQMEAMTAQKRQESKKTSTFDSLFKGDFIREVAQSRIFDCKEGQNEQQISNSTLILTGGREIKGSFIQQQISIRDFQLGKCVGSGKFGDVHLSRHKETGMLFAIKKIFKATILEYDMLPQLTLELKIHYLLSPHPNLVTLYTHFSDQYHIFLVMEYAVDGMLMDYLKKQQKFVSGVIDQMLDAVDAMHSKKVAHRDIKPENILVFYGNTFKLCDFGWSSIFDQNIMKKTFCGTLDYVSPEMKDKGQYSHSIDLWSLGVLTFELITGVPPFKEQIAHWRRKGSKRNAAWNWNILYPPEISGVSESFMRNLLKEKPEERASIRFCKNHLFLRKYRSILNQTEIQREIQIQKVIQ